MVSISKSLKIKYEMKNNLLTIKYLEIKNRTYFILYHWIILNQLVIKTNQPWNAPQVILIIIFQYTGKTVGMSYSVLPWFKFVFFLLGFFFTPVKI